MNKLLKKLKRTLAPHFNRNSAFFRAARKVYKFADRVTSALYYKRTIEKARKLVLANHLLRSISVTKDLPSGCIVEFNDGNKFWWRDPADPHHLLSIIITTDVGSESHETLTRFVQSGDTVFDIGANFGWHSMELIRSVGALGEIYCFEPAPEAHKELKENAKINFPNFKNVHIEQAALGDEDKKIELYIPKELGSAFSSVFRGYTGFSAETCAVDMAMLDTFVSRNKITNVDFIKCDVEGAQMLLVKGAKQFLLSQAPVIYMEVNEKDPKEIFAEMGKFGYSAYYFKESRLQKFDASDFAAALPDYNFVFAKPEKLDRLKRFM